MSRPRVIEGSLAEGGRVVEDAWAQVETLDELRAAPADASLLVPHALWMMEREALGARAAPVGIRLEPEDEPATIASELARFALIAIRFPKFTDGRGYSTARLLRERYGYTGPLRAVGDVLRDQLFYLLRCGFDSFEMKHPERIDDALAAYADFSESYQTAVDRTRPLFARREATA